MMGGLPSKDSVLLRDRGGDPDTEEKRREDGGRDGREAATSSGPPGTPRSWKRQEGPSPGASGGSVALGPPDLRRLVARMGEGGCL